MGNEKNNSSQQETVTIPAADPQKIKELERKLEEKNQEIDKIKKQAESNIKTDLTKGVINQNTFKHNFKNGYADGTVAEQKKKILADRKKARAGIK